MTVLNIATQVPFTTKDGSTIRSILDRTNAPVKNQSLAEATIPAGCAIQRHHHRLSEEFYFILEGRGSMEMDGELREVTPRRRHPHPARRMAHHHRSRNAPLPLLLRPALQP